MSLKKINSLLYKINKFLYPEEIFIILFFSLLFLFFSIKNWQLILWEPNSLFNIILNILIAIFAFVILSFLRHVISFKKQRIKKSFKKNLLFFIDILRIWIVFYSGLLAYMNIKIKVPFINSKLFDEFFYKSDLLFSWLTKPIFFSRNYLQQYLDLSVLYVILFQCLFLITFVIVYFKNKKGFREMFFVTLLVLIFGALFYCLFPAMGPFYYKLSPSPYVREIQQMMITKYELYRNSNGLIYSSNYLLLGIAAMPSLHTANTLVFLFFIYKYVRRLTILYLIIFAYIITDAVYTRYHYFVDVVFGMFLAWFCIIIGLKIYEKREKYIKKYLDIYCKNKEKTGKVI